MKLLQTKHGANSSSGDRLFLISVPATVGCRVACAPRAHNRRRPRVEGNKVVPWPTRRGRNMHRHISRRLHPLHASQDARRPQGRVAAERRASEQAKQQKPPYFSWNGPTRLLLRLCCTAPALCWPRVTLLCALRMQEWKALPAEEQPQAVPKLIKAYQVAAALRCARAC